MTNPDIESCLLKVKTLIKARISLPTLFGQSEVSFGVDDENNLFCKPIYGEITKITDEYIRMTCNRYNDLKARDEINQQGTPLHKSASEFTDDKWDDCPNRKVCPYIAKLLLLLDELKALN